MANCLLLGANGFLGSHLVDRLVAQGHFVRCFDKFPHNQTRFTQGPSTELFHGEFLNETDLNNALDGMDYVFHFVSTTTPLSSESNPLVEVDTNIHYSVELLRLCVEHSVRKVIYSSSGGSIYGNSQDELLAETTTPRPMSPYAIGKLAVENFLRYFHEKHGLESVTYRISNPYGTRQSVASKQGVIPIFLHNMMTEKPLTIFGDGNMVRDYIYVNDAISMIATSFELSTQDVYNVGAGRGYSVNEIVYALTDITGITPDVRHVPVPSTFVEKNVLDTTRYVTEFGAPTYTEFTQGIKETWDYFLSQKS